MLIQSDTRFYIVAVIILCALTVGAVVGAIAFGNSNTQTLVTAVTALMTPVITGLLAAGLHSMQTSIDGRMADLVQATAEKEHVKGLVEGLIVNPKTNVTSEDLAQRIPLPVKTDLDKIKQEVQLQEGPALNRRMDDNK